MKKKTYKLINECQNGTPSSTLYISHLNWDFFFFFFFNKNKKKSTEYEFQTLSSLIH